MGSFTWSPHALLAFLASYLLFPQWELNQLGNYMESVLKANIDYLLELATTLSGKKSSTLRYKLVRKEVFLSTANLSAAFIRMSSEPKSKQRNKQEIYEFVVLNHMLSSNVAGVIAGIPAGEPPTCQTEALHVVKRSIHTLEESLRYIDKDYEPRESAIRVATTLPEERQAGNQLLEQLDFIYKLTSKINKITFVILR